MACARIFGLHHPDQCHLITSCSGVWSAASARRSYVERRKAAVFVRLVRRPFPTATRATVEAQAIREPTAEGFAWQSTRANHKEDARAMVLLDGGVAALRYAVIAEAGHP